jgi:hypothetical protein
VYTDSIHCDTLRYEWLLAHCCHLIVCLVVLMDGLEDGYAIVYHDDYCHTLNTLMMLALCPL